MAFVGDIDDLTSEESSLSKNELRATPKTSTDLRIRVACGTSRPRLQKLPTCLPNSLPLVVRA